MNNKNKYVVFDIKKKDETTEIYFIRMNEDYRILDSFECLIKNDFDKKRFLQKFKKWLGNPYDYKYVAYEKQELVTITEEFSKIDDKMNPLKALRSCFIELKREVDVKVQDREHISAKSILGSFGIHFLGDINSTKDCCYNYASLFACDMLIKERIIKEEKQKAKERLREKNTFNSNYRKRRY